MKPKLYYGLFFDILGQKDFFSRLKTGREFSDGVAFLNAAIKDFIYEMVEDQIWPLQFLEKLPKGFREEKFDRLSILPMRKLKYLARHLDVGVIQFSDSTLCCVEAENPWSGCVLNAWANCLLTWMMGLRAIGLNLRGAISIGEAYPVRMGQYVGPLIDELGHLEKTAFSSRIVISKNLVEWQKQNAERMRKGLRGDAGLTDLFMTFVGCDFDLTCILDELSVFKPHLHTNKEHIRQLKIDYERALRSNERSLAGARGRTAWQIEALCDSLASRGECLGLKRIARLPPIKLPRRPRPRVCNYLLLYLCYKPGVCNDRGMEHLVKRLSVIVSKLREIQLSRRREIRMGVSHVSNYVMFYVEDNGVAARREFSASLLSVASNILSDMPRNALVYGSIVRGKGWEVTTNCLMGPLIGDAHRIAEKDVVYPRIIVDDPVVRIVHRKLDELPIPLAQDLDKKYASSA